MAVDRPTLLVLRALGLGDLLTAVPALRALRRAHPRHRLLLAGPAGLAPLARLSGAVDDVLPAEGLAAPPVLRLPGPPPALAVNLHGRGPESTWSLAALRPPRLWAFAHPDAPGVGTGPAWPERAHEVERWCRLLEFHGLRADPGDLHLAPPPGVPSPAPGAVVLHPGAASGARRWPADRYAEVAAALRADGHRVVVTAGPGEERLAAAVGGEVLRPDLPRLAALVAGAELVVCGDTGVGHLATAYRTPSVLLFGPTPPARWGPRRGPHTVLWAGGTGDPHGAEPDPGLLELGVADVLAAARRWTRATVAP